MLRRDNKAIVRRSGEMLTAGVGGASRMSTITCGGVRYPVPDAGATGCRRVCPYSTAVKAITDTATIANDLLRINEPPVVRLVKQREITEQTEITAGSAGFQRACIYDASCP